MDRTGSLCICASGIKFVKVYLLGSDSVGKSAWLQNASIKGQFLAFTSLRCFTNGQIENILFNLPYVHNRYQRTLEVRAGFTDG